MDNEHSGSPPFWRSPAGLTLLVAAAVGGFLLFTEHRAHVLGVVPYALLLACPLMHMFMHHGHHHGARGDGRAERTDDERPGK
ncbi:DUF2933 domain-containing protein [Variovorax paradoxus]|uniref:DUF2933 domain-containing protein n=1 Tax=Variovorax paradoxus TaxID=34073 RepID=UPI002785B5A4|nr:DUF2933 domain-containing protein [Variovorax paradoxus]MDP9927945.1 hypothetical protein [Variovorax paradoxus]